MPAVSVVMPMYNAGGYLSEAIESILAQTFSDFEFIVIDDGSTDSSVSIVRSYTDPRIRLVAEPHRGLVASLNKGIAEARGSLIARMDADDISEPERLERQVARMQAEPETVVLGCWASVIDANGIATGRFESGPETDGAIRPHMLRWSPFVHGSTMFRRDAVLAVGAYRDAFAAAEEYDLWFRLAEIGRMGNIVTPLYRFRTHRGSTTVRWGNSLVKRYLDMALRLALQRFLQGRDELGYVIPAGGEGLVPAGADPALKCEILAHWAQVILKQGHLKLARRLALWALEAQPFRHQAWVITLRCYLGKATARELFALARRACAYLGRRPIGHDRP